MPERKIVTPGWVSKTIEWDREIACIGTVTSEKRTRPDGSQITYTLLVAHDDLGPLYYDLLLDERFIKYGIETEPNGLLINQGKTSLRWEAPAGIKPEEWMAQKDDFLTPALTVIGFPATNAFWQKGEFFIRFGKVLHLPNDETLTGTYDVLILTGDGWSAQEISLVNGEAQNPIDTIDIGLSMPLIIKNGLSVPQQEIVANGHKRVLADIRNFVDFSAGAYENPDFNIRFFELVRRFQPSTISAARRITYEGGLAVVRANVTKAEADEFKTIVEDERWGLDRYFRVAEVGDENHPTRVAIQGPFPPNRTPVTLIGHTEDGKLIAGFFNGRQKTSTGVSFDEAASIMKEKGAVNIGIGVAGGDVSAVLKTQGMLKGTPGFEILNSPSNKNHQTRLAPNILTLKVPDPRAGFLY